MAQMKLIYTTIEKLDELEVLNGQIIFVPNDNVICLDMRDQRFVYKTIRTFATDVQRVMDTSGAPGFYYVEETNIIWRKALNGTWRQITPSNLSPIFYGQTTQSFPQTGVEGILYYTKEGVYGWDSTTNEYVLIANANTWGSIQ